MEQETKEEMDDDMDGFFKSANDFEEKEDSQDYTEEDWIDISQLDAPEKFLRKSSFVISSSSEYSSRSGEDDSAPPLFAICPLKIRFVLHNHFVSVPWVWLRVES